MRLDHFSMLQNSLEIFQEGSYQYKGNSIPLKLSSTQMKEVEVYLPNDIKEICLKKDFDHIHVNEIQSFASHKKNHFLFL